MMSLWRFGYVNTKTLVNLSRYFSDTGYTCEDGGESTVFEGKCTIRADSKKTLVEVGIRIYFNFEETKIILIPNHQSDW